MNDDNPFISPGAHDPGADRDLVRNCTRGTLAFVMSIVVVCAGWHLIRGCVFLMQARSPRTVYPENPLVPTDLERLTSATSRSDLWEGRTAVGLGIVLASAAALTGRNRRKLLPTLGGVDAKAKNPHEYLRRFAGYGLVASILSVLSSPNLHGVTWVWYVRAAHISEFFILVGFGASILALAIGRDARIRIVDGLVPYALAGLGIVLTCGISVWMYMGSFYRLLYRLGAFG